MVELERVLGFSSLTGPQQQAVIFALRGGATIDKFGRLVIVGEKARDHIARSHFAEDLPPHLLSEKTQNPAGLYRNVKPSKRPPQFRPKVFKGSGFSGGKTPPSARKPGRRFGLKPR